MESSLPAHARFPSIIFLNWPARFRWKFRRHGLQLIQPNLFNVR